MTTEYFSIGDALSSIDEAALRQERSKVLFRALTQASVRREFSIVELRREGESDVIIADCVCDQVPSRNKAGIQVRERVAIVVKDKGQPEVRALRKDFPIGLHVNPSMPGSAPSLCLYEGLWTYVERTWTPQKFLKRIQWWLTQTAKGELHAPDQRLEQLYFNEHEEVVLPPDFEARVERHERLDVDEPVQATTTTNVYAAHFTSGDTRADAKFVGLAFVIPPVVHSRTEVMPATLGELHDRFANQGVQFVEILAERAKTMIPKGKESGRDYGKLCLVVVQVPLKRFEGAEPEPPDLLAFAIKDGLAEFGLRCGVFFENKGKISVPVLLKPSAIDPRGKWRDLKIIPVTVRRSASKQFARNAAGHTGNTHVFRGVIAGLGALGGTLAEMWSKEGWGQWTYVDADYIKPHNVLRHVAKHEDIGRPKVNVVQRLTQADYEAGCSPASAIQKDIQDDDKAVGDALATAEFLVDVTTTLEAPRELARNEKAPRCASVFLTPSGQSSVVLLEDKERRVRLDSLEAQYYRAVLSQDWGQTHLSRPKGIRVGGCREISATIPLSSIQLHAAIVARQLQGLRDDASASIRIWRHDAANGAVVSEYVQAQPVAVREVSGWRVVVDDGTRRKASKIRYDKLPAETGGVIVGYTDHKTKTVYIVDILGAPADSRADASEFTRGAAGLAETLAEVRRRTDGVVDYIGEWHSHPEFSRATPSPADRELLDYLASKLASDGEPALMMIVGRANEISLSVRVI
jgi:integrative and conjugative element protein (TIGR02256 family)